MAKVVNSDRLIFIITNYGLGRIAEAMASSTVTLNLSKVKIGSGKNYEYYVPNTEQTELLGPIKDDLGNDVSFFVTEKELLEDKVTVSFRVIIPEKYGGFDIREVGLYEVTESGEEKLFAICVQQPIVKPEMIDNYLMVIDYYIYLKSQNLSSVYDQIILDSENQVITVNELQELLRTILFVQSNLSDQIGHNADILGMGRVSQLYERIEENRNNYSYNAIYNNFADLLGFVNESEIFGYWVFNYPRRTVANSSITDISHNKINMSSDAPINTYSRVYNGLLSFLDFKVYNSAKPHYFYLSPDVSLSLLDSSGQQDIDFSMIFVLEGKTPYQGGTPAIYRTFLAQSNAATNSNVFEVNEKSDKSLDIVLYEDTNNYISFNSGEEVIPDGPVGIVITYDATTMGMKCYVNGNKVELTRYMQGTYHHMNNNPSILYGFSVSPYEEIYWVPSEGGLGRLLNEDGTDYSGVQWTINGTKIEFEGQETPEYTADNIIYYAWTYGAHTIYTRNLVVSANEPLYYGDDVNGYGRYEGSEFSVVSDGLGGYKVQYDFNDTTQGASKTLYAFKYSYSVELIWSNDPVNPSILYNQDGTLYADNTGTGWSIVNNQIYYRSTFLATYDSTHNIEIQSMGITSYRIDSGGNIVTPINANVGLVSIIKAGLSEEQARMISLGLSALTGNNPCVDFLE